MIESGFRELTPEEKREYQDWIRTVREQTVRMQFFDKIAFYCFFLGGPIAGAWVALESDGPASRQAAMGVFGLFVAEFLLCIFFWDLVERRIFKRKKKPVDAVEEIEKILAANRVEFLRVRAGAVVAFEEIGDLGPYYAFQAEENEILCVGGQNYFDLKKFPNDDFEIVKLPMLEDEIRCLGNKLKPIRTIPAQTYRSWEAPFDGDRFPGKLLDLEKILPGRKGGRA